MKKGKLLLLVVLMLVLCLFAVACGEEEDPATGDEHTTCEYKYTITKGPTETEKGEATGTCSECKATTTYELPVLTDTEFWSVKSETAATCTKAGSKVYSCTDFGDYTVTTPKLGHDIATQEWVIHTEPTMTTKGIATRTCSKCGLSETRSLPEFSNTDYWEQTANDTADHTQPGKQEWVSIGYKVDDKPVYTITHTQPQIEHSWEWTITTEPTETDKGEVTGVCICTATETKELPALSDTEFWTLETTAATYNSKGSKVYTCEYGTVTVEIPKLVAPYDNMSYYPVVLNGHSVDSGNGNGIAWSYTDNCIVLDANGRGFYDAGVIGRGYWVIEMIDAATGKIKVTVWESTFPSIDTDEDDDLDALAEVTGPTTDMTVVETVLEGYVDFVTGAIVLKNENSLWNKAFALIPSDTKIEHSTTKTSIWNANTIVYEIPAGETTHTALIANGTVTFGVDIKDAEGNALAADACYNAPYVFITKTTDAGTLAIASYGFDGEKMVVLDELYGTYTDGTDTVKLSGFGTLVYNNTINGIYTVAPEGAAYDLDVYMLDDSGNKIMYLQVTLGENNTYTKVQPMVDVTFDAGSNSSETVPAGSYNTNIPVTLPTPVPSDEKYILIGWTDGVKTYLVGEQYIPTVNATLTAVWGDRCVVTVSGAMDGDNDNLYLAVGDAVLPALPDYTTDTIDLTAMKSFVRWFADMNGNGIFDEGVDVEIVDNELVIEDGMAAISVVAEWKDLPKYYGTYFGYEYDNFSETIGNGIQFSIDKDGVISGTGFSGNMADYNAATKTIVLTTPRGSRTAYFDIDLGIFVYSWGTNTNYVSDVFLLIRGASADNKADIQHALIENTSGSDGYRVITYKVGDVVSTILIVSDDGVYADVVVTDGYGDALAIENIATSETVVITGADGTVLVQVAADSNWDGMVNSYGTTSDTKDLDGLQGAYTTTGDDKVVKLDGAGNVKYDGKTGTYTLSGTTYDVYLADKTEYYVLTIDTTAKTYTIVKPTVEISFEGTGDAAVDAMDANTNVVTTLPIPTKAGYVFRGWYVAGAEGTLYTTYTATGDAAVVLTAKWDIEYTLTVHYNGGATTEEPATTYGAGDTVEIVPPTLSGSRFVGWYTTGDFQAGTEWTSGTAISGNLELWAKWGEPVAGWGDYLGYKMNNGDTLSTTTSDTREFHIDELGVLSDATGEYSGNLATDYDAATKLFKITRTYEEENWYSGSIEIVTDTYYCYFDAEAGLLLFPNIDGASYYDFSNNVIVMVKGMTEADKTSIVNQAVKKEGSSSIGYRLVSYTVNGTTYTHLLAQKTVYTNVTISDAYGATLALTEVKTAKTLMVKQGETIVLMLAAVNDSFGTGYTSSMSKTVALDGLQGTYTTAGDDKTVVLDGVGGITYDGKTGTYTLSGTTYDVYLADKAEYYVLTIDTTAKTYTIVKPTVEISFEDTGDAAVDGITANTNVVTTLPIPTKAGYVFRGWYVAGAEETLYTDAYTATGDAAVVLIAKWDVAYSYKVHYNGADNVTDIDTTYGAGDMMAIAQPKKAGYRFLGWYTTADFQDGTKWDLNNTAIAADTEVWAKWGEPFAGYGTYTGKELYYEVNGSSSTSAKTIVIDEEGNVTGAFNGSMTEWDPETKLVVLYKGSSTDTKRTCYFDPVAGIFVGADGSSGKIAYDGHVFIKGVTSVSNMHGYGMQVEGTSEVGYRIVSYTIGSDSYMILITNTTVYANVTVTDGAGNAVTNADDIKNLKAITVKQGETTVLALAAVNDTFSGQSATTSFDGTQGTYTTGDLGTITSNGVGSLTIGESTVAYTKVDSTLYFNYNNKYTAITLGEDAYTVVENGIQGTYARPESAGDYVLDGYGNVTGVGTYTVDGTSIVIYIDGVGTAYGLDVENKALLGKSVFAGLTFTGTYYSNHNTSNEVLKVVFDDSSVITGVMSSGSWNATTFTFTGVLDGTTLTLTIIDSNFASSSIGETVVFSISGETMTVISDFEHNAYSFASNGTVTCAGFSL